MVTDTLRAAIGVATTSNRVWVSVTGQQDALESDKWCKVAAIIAAVKGQ